MNLPENAFRELKDGEQYEPLMGPDKAYPEVNVWSVTWGILMAVIFSAAAAYLGLKVGQVFEAAIPIAIIAVGVAQPPSATRPWARMSSYRVSEPVRVPWWREPSSPCQPSIFCRPSIPR